jgi:N-acetyl sugar amidotransferase
MKMPETREKLESKFGLPETVVFCKSCVMSNQRPVSTPEFRHARDHRHRGLHIDEGIGICDACRYAAEKEAIDWKTREEELVRLLDRYRRRDGYYDCVLPGSGGKDSVYAAHVLKYKYGMHPLTVTWSPMIYTEIGWKNFRNWIRQGGFDNVTFNYNAKVHALLTKLAIENLFHPFQPFILGQKNLAPKIAVQYAIPLIFYGENEAEYGNPIADNVTSLRDKSFYTMQHLSEVRLSGVPVRELLESYSLGLNDLLPYLPEDASRLAQAKVEVHYLGYYLRWTPQEAYYYAVENAGFQASPVRTEGTYSKYNSLDDRIDGFHYYTSYIKFGLGRASSDASQEIRNKHLTREEGVALVRKFDGEFPSKYFQEVMDYIGMETGQFMELCDRFRSPHLWEKEDGQWKLKYQVT